jgi:alpha-mannosidase
VSRFDCTLTVLKKDVFDEKDQSGDSVCVSNGEAEMRISRKTGLIEHYAVGAKTYIENSGSLEVYRDDEDPWGMRVNGFKDKIGSFTLMSDEDANAFVCYPDAKTPNVRIVEDGEVRTKVQAFFSYKRSVAVVEYTLPKNSSYIDVDIAMYSNEPCNMIKYRIDTALCGKPYGETAFGFEEMYDNEDESVFHKWCGIKETDDALYVMNRGTYGGSFTDKTIKLSLLRTPVYSAHPINDRPYAPHDRFINHIDMGERHFSFRISTERNIALAAQVYNEAPQALSFFPSGLGERISSLISIDNPRVILSSIKKKGGSFVLDLYNASEEDSEAEIRVCAKDKRIKLKFGKHEIKKVEI